MNWVRRFNLGSPTLEHTDSARCGRVLGSGRTLESVEEARLREIVRDGRPSAVSLQFTLWSRCAVQAAVKSRFGVDMPLRTVMDYLHSWGLTPQRPVKAAIEQRPADMQRWLDEEYPAIERRAKVERGEIYWGDETAVRQDTALVRGFAPTGHTPELRHRAYQDFCV
ncbi:winged helix-turn-helix domain-containing protein [Caldimonas tepidiphila]|uniref:winged helix-turn-helix domain-containing protein n=1 Tax=Caldimonas tepidiphila TaxID=2315841 RepID=UPI000E5B0F9E|nr:winged helix-turn-helix domain-containing protein [Caldimonas tepidiphila]